MDLQKTAREIGLFETAINLAKVNTSPAVIQQAGTTMPIPDESITADTQRIAAWLLDLNKEKYMFLSPEIALIDEMARQTKRTREIIITLPCDLEADAKERIRNNLPRGLDIAILEEPYFPHSFFPGNGMMVICGYSAGGRAMVFSDTYRLIEHYSGFLGKKAFIPFMETNSAVRYDGWLEMNQQRINVTWRNEL